MNGIKDFGQTFIAYPNDKITINDISFKIPYLASVNVLKVQDFLEIRIMPQKRIEEIKI